MLFSPFQKFNQSYLSDPFLVTVAIPGGAGPFVLFLPERTKKHMKPTGACRHRPFSPNNKGIFLFS